MELLITPGAFERGGWTFITDFIPAMHMPYLMAHGIGRPVEDATAAFTFPEGKCRMHVYTFNWVAPWHPEEAPGRFEVLIDGRQAGVFGDAPESWGFVSCEVSLSGTEHTVRLHDLTGFDGRLGCILLTDDMSAPSPLPEELPALYRRLTGNPKGRTVTADLAIAGAGLSGMCAAVMAARRGLRVALIGDRPVVGGNNSSEVRVWLGGSRNAEPLPGVGNIVGEFEQKKVGHYGPENTADLYEDERKEELILAAGVDLLKNCSVIGVNAVKGNEASDQTGNGSCTGASGQAEKRNCRMIESLEVWDTAQDEIFTVSAPLFADCTGDGTVGFLAGADLEVTTNGHMGKTNVWHVRDTGHPVPFPSCPWAIDLKGIDIPGRKNVPDIYGSLREKSLGCWFWEAGMERDPVLDSERARDLNLRAMYGAWDALKNHDGDYETWEIGESMVVGGMRESRRLLGDVLLTKADVQNGPGFPDGCVPSFWNFDVHYPDPRFYGAFREGEAFLTHDYHERFKKPFWIPYRCLYSRNIGNLFMAGRDVSVSHDALGTVRVMRTCGMMGEIVGLSASLCNAHSALPRDIWLDHLDEFKAALREIPRNDIPLPTTNTGM